MHGFFNLRPRTYSSFIENHPIPHEEDSIVPVVSIDIDGVLVNYVQAILDTLFMERRGIWTFEQATCSASHAGGPCAACICLDPAFQHLLRADQIGREEYGRLIEAALRTPDFYSHAPAFIHESEDLTKLQDFIMAGRILVNFIGTRKNLKVPGPRSDARLLTLEWLDNHKLHGYLSANIMSRDKIADLLRDNVAAHLDDEPEAVENLRSVGLNAYLITRPWNANRYCKWRVESISEFLDIVAPEQRALLPVYQDALSQDVLSAR
jgi:hypothetical protein